MNDLITEAEKNYLQGGEFYELSGVSYELDSIQDLADLYGVCEKYFTKEMDWPGVIIDTIEWAARKGIDINPKEILGEIETRLLNSETQGDISGTGYCNVHIIIRMANLFAIGTYQDQDKVPLFFRNDNELERFFCLALERAQVVDEFIWIAECVACKYGGWHIRDEARTQRVTEEAQKDLTAAQMKKLKKKISEFLS